MLWFICFVCLYFSLLLFANTHSSFICFRYVSAFISPKFTTHSCTFIIIATILKSRFMVNWCFSLFSTTSPHIGIIDLRLRTLRMRLNKYVMMIRKSCWYSITFSYLKCLFDSFRRLIPAVRSHLRQLLS